MNKIEWKEKRWEDNKGKRYEKIKRKYEGNYVMYERNKTGTLREKVY
jgi:hypothetical protein